MRVWHRIAVVAVVGLLLVVGVVGCGGGAGGLGIVGKVIPYRETSMTVSPLERMTMTINMSKGAVFEGYMTVRGGNDDIRFYLKDSYGNKVLDINRVKGRYDFSYIATSEGFHTAYFDNSFSVLTSKQVYVSYRVR